MTSDATTTKKRVRSPELRLATIIKHVTSLEWQRANRIASALGSLSPEDVELVSKHAADWNALTGADLISVRALIALKAPKAQAAE